MTEFGIDGKLSHYRVLETYRWQVCFRRSFLRFLYEPARFVGLVIIERVMFCWSARSQLRELLALDHVFLRMSAGISAGHRIAGLGSHLRWQGSVSSCYLIVHVLTMCSVLSLPRRLLPRWSTCLPHQVSCCMHLTVSWYNVMCCICPNIISRPLYPCYFRLRLSVEGAVQL